MKNNVNRKNINVDKQNIIPLWNFKQEDDAILKLALYKGAIPFDITGQTIVLGAKRPNNTVVEQTNGFTINGNEIDIALKNNILAVNGLVELDLQITDVNGKLTSASFFITVFKKVLGENNLNASNDISAINQLVADLQAKTEEVNNAISTIEPKADKLMNDIQTDYNSLQKIIIDENQAANLQGQITNLGSQLEQKAPKNNVIDYNNSSDLYLGTFFDYSKEFKSYMYGTTDGINFNLISKTPVSVGKGDPGIIFYNGKFYQLVDDNDPSLKCSFRIYVSENLKDWQDNIIYLDDFTEENYRVYGADWFIDNNKVYIVYALQQGYMTDSAQKQQLNFRPKIVEVNLKNMSFSSSRFLNIDNYNRIDPTIVKENDKYYLFIKKEITEGSLLDGSISIWISTDLINWTKQKDTIESFNGYKFEGVSLCKIKDTWFMYVDDWAGTFNGYMHYATSTDLLNWSEPKKIQNQNRLRHGSVFKIDSVLGKKIIHDYYVNEILSSNTDNPFLYNKFVNGLDIKSNYNNKYIELISIDMPMTWTAFNLTFKITDTQNSFYNSEIVLSGRNKSDISTLFDCVFIESKNYKTSLGSDIVVVSSNGKHRIFLSIGSKVSITPTISIIGFEGHQSITFEVKNNEIIDSLPSGTIKYCEKNTEVSDLRTIINDLKTNGIRTSKKIETLNNPTVTIKFYGVNGLVRLKGHCNGYAYEEQIIDHSITLLNGNIGLFKNKSTYADIQVNKISYDNYVYELEITTTANYSIFDIELPIGSYFI